VQAARIAVEAWSSGSIRRRRVQDDELLPEPASRLLRSVHLGLRIRIAWIHEHRNRPSVGHQLAQQLKSLCLRLE